MTTDAFIVFGGLLAFLLIVLGLALAFTRLAIGPTLPDRVVALDVIGAVSTGFIAAYAVLTDEPVFIDVAILLALISFIAAVAFARYVERRSHDE